MTEYQTDYAPHAIRLKHRMKAMQAEFLKGEYGQAIDVANEALVELRLVVVALKELQRKQETRDWYA